MDFLLNGEIVPMTLLSLDEERVVFDKGIFPKKEVCLVETCDGFSEPSQFLALREEALEMEESSEEHNYYALQNDPYAVVGDFAIISENPFEAELIF